MNLIERMNDWCGDVLNKVVRYDDLITFVSLTLLLFAGVGCLIVGILGFLGFLK